MTRLELQLHLRVRQTVLQRVYTGDVTLDELKEVVREAGLSLKRLPVALSYLTSRNLIAKRGGKFVRGRT